MVEFDPNPNLQIFDLSNKKFEPILDFQMKSLFPNIVLETLQFILGNIFIIFFNSYLYIFSHIFPRF